jgi:hypothetical protein
MNFIADIFRKWNGAGEGWGDSIQYMHGTVIALQHKIHYQLFGFNIQ